MSLSSSNRQTEKRSESIDRHSAGQVRRIALEDRQPVPFNLNGASRQGFEGDSVLTALLGVSRSVRDWEFGPERRAGFCWIGMCQDCWVRLRNGETIRACTTPLVAGLDIVTEAENAS